MKTIKIFSYAFLGVFLFFLATQELRAQYYTAVDLGTLGGNWSEAGGINSSGLVVGSSRTSDGLSAPFSYSGGVMKDLGTLPGPDNSGASAVNDDGLIVGTSGTDAFSYFGGILTDLGTLPGAKSSQANAVNSKGLIVGVSGGHAFSDFEGVMTDLGTFGGTYASAEGVNDSGTIVGAYTPSEGGEHAFSETDGIFTDLGTFGGAYSVASAINNEGLIVGSYYTPNGNLAYSYNDGVMTKLGTLGGQSDAFAVNDFGQVVGTSDLILGEGFYNAFSEIGGTMTDLNAVTDSEGADLATLTFATGVNDEGQVVGIAIDNAGENVAFLLTPTTTAPTQPLSDFAGWFDQGRSPSVSDGSYSISLLILGIAGIGICSRILAQRFFSSESGS